MNKNLLESLSEEQIAKIKHCKNSEEILRIAKEEGLELNDEQLEAVSGGCGYHTPDCPKCGSHNVREIGYSTGSDGNFWHVHCLDCNHYWSFED